MTKTIQAELARRIGRDRKATDSLLQALTRALARHCGELDTVAIPSFGNFAAVKHDEQIITDRSTGARLMLPPEVELTFKPAARLRRIADQKQE